MKVIIEPKQEEEIVKATDSEASPDEVRDQLKVRYEACVNPLCGCASDC